jgi:homoserine kinase type II
MSHTELYKNNYLAFMSVYTRVTQQQLQGFLLLYTLGDLVSFFGIEAGIENTNYAVNTTKGQFILTIYESFAEKELPQFFFLLNDLKQNNFPAPVPQKCRRGCFLNQLKGKPAAIFNRLPGCSVDNPSVGQCYQIGEYLAKLHSCTSHSNFQQTNTTF